MTHTRPPTPGPPRGRDSSVTGGAERPGQQLVRGWRPRGHTGQAGGLGDAQGRPGGLRDAWGRPGGLGKGPQAGAPARPASGGGGGPAQAPVLCWRGRGGGVVHAVGHGGLWLPGRDPELGQSSPNAGLTEQGARGMGTRQETRGHRPEQPAGRSCRCPCWGLGGAGPAWSGCHLTWDQPGVTCPRLAGGPGWVGGGGRVADP